MLTTTIHAETRMQHRAICPSDLQFLEAHATIIDEGYLLTNKDVQAIEAEAKRLITKAHRLKGMFLAVSDDVVITVYRAHKKNKCRKLLRN